MKIAFLCLSFLVTGVILGTVFDPIGRYLEGKYSVQWRFTEAAAQGNISELERLYKKGGKVNEGSSFDGNPSAAASPLLRATMNLQVGSAKWLIAHGADINKKESDATPLEVARYKFDCAQQLIDLFSRNTVEQGAAANP